MKKNNTFRFTTTITPETEVLLNGRHGRPLTMSLDDGIAPKSVILDTESVIRLQAFLSDFLQGEEKGPAVPTYEPTGRAIAVMDGDTLDILRVFRTANVVGFADAEQESYEALCDKVRGIVDAELPSNVVFILFDTYDGSISRKVIRRILRACVTYQVDFVRSGNVFRSRRMVLEDIEAFTTIDMSVISRATRNVKVLAPKGTFTMNSNDASVGLPSLFDEGSKTIDGKDCSRKAVLATLCDILVEEDKRLPYTDEEMSDILADRGYAVARRTVTKYRELLGIPKRSARRIRL